MQALHVEADRAQPSLSMQSPLAHTPELGRNLLALKPKRHHLSAQGRQGCEGRHVDLQGPKGAKAFEKAEDPIYALEHNLPIDAQHYLDHHLEQPLMRIFEPIMRNPQELLHGAAPACRRKIAVSSSPSCT